MKNAFESFVLSLCIGLKPMKISNLRNGRIVANDARVARSIISRIIGVIGQREFASGTALVIPGCRQVHTFFVRFPIDLVFTDKHSTVIQVLADVSPCCMTGYYLKATQVIELPAGSVSAFAIRQGDRLLVEDMK